MFVISYTQNPEVQTYVSCGCKCGAPNARAEAQTTNCRRRCHIARKATQGAKYQGCNKNLRTWSGRGKARGAGGGGGGGTRFGGGG